MLGGLRDGERCLIAALADGWRELDGGAEPARPQEWFTSLMRERCFDELARRAPAGPRTTSTAPATASRSPPMPRSRRCARPIATSLLLRDVHGLDTALLCVVTDMSAADVENQLYRARAEFASAVCSQPRAGRLQRAPQRLPGLRRARAPARPAAARPPAPRPAPGARSGARRAPPQRSGRPREGHSRTTAPPCLTSGSSTPHLSRCTPWGRRRGSGSRPPRAPRWPRARRSGRARACAMPTPPACPS